LRELLLGGIVCWGFLLLLSVVLVVGVLVAAGFAVVALADVDEGGEYGEGEDDVAGGSGRGGVIWWAVA